MSIIYNGHCYLIQIFHKWRFQKILGNHELVMNFGSFGQTMVCLDSLWLVYETCRWGPNGVLWSQCDVPFHHHVLQHDANGNFGTIDRCFNIMQPLNLSFCMNFLKISNEIVRAWCKHHLACECARLCQIWGHLNNARLINGPRVANWGW